MKMWNHLKNTSNSPLKAVLERMVEEKRSGWVMQVEEYMQIVSRFSTMKKEKITNGESVGGEKMES